MSRWNWFEKINFLAFFSFSSQHGDRTHRDSTGCLVGCGCFKYVLQQLRAAGFKLLHLQHEQRWQNSNIFSSPWGARRHKAKWSTTTNLSHACTVAWWRGNRMSKRLWAANGRRRWWYCRQGNQSAFASICTQLGRQIEMWDMCLSVPNSILFIYLFPCSGWSAMTPMILIFQ